MYGFPLFTGLSFIEKTRTLVKRTKGIPVVTAQNTKASNESKQKKQDVATSYQGTLISKK